MKAVLIYDDGIEFAPLIEVKEFNSKEDLIDFINDKNIGSMAIAAYEFMNKINIQPRNSN